MNLEGLYDGNQPQHIEGIPDTEYGMLIDFIKCMGYNCERGKRLALRLFDMGDYISAAYVFSYLNRQFSEDKEVMFFKVMEEIASIIDGIVEGRHSFEDGMNNVRSLRDNTLPRLERNGLLTGDTKSLIEQKIEEVLDKP